MESLSYTTQRSASIYAFTDVLWSITDRCNLHCSYCAVVPQTKKTRPEPSQQNIDRILTSLQKLPNLETIVFTGGEALLSDHIEYVLKCIKDMVPIKYLITNGTNLTSRSRYLIKKYKPRIMVSIDSLDEEINSLTRGTFTLSKALDTIQWLLDIDIFTIVILVLTRHNVASIENTLDRLYNIGVSNFLIQQLHCSSNSLAIFFRHISPSHEQISQLTSTLHQFRESHTDAIVDDNEISFFNTRPSVRLSKCLPDVTYHPQRLFLCGAAYNLFTIMTNGDVLPCNAFLDSVGGNIHLDELESILLNSEVFKGLQILRKTRVDQIKGCVNCPDRFVCDGGCRADVFNLTGNIYAQHPYCPRVVTSSAFNSK